LLLDERVVGLGSCQALAGWLAGRPTNSNG
jgi:hypothetical protein